MIKGETDIGHQFFVFTLVPINVNILFIVYGIKGTDVTESVKLFVVLIDITSLDITSFDMR